MIIFLPLSSFFFSVILKRIDTQKKKLNNKNNNNIASKKNSNTHNTKIKHEWNHGNKKYRPDANSFEQNEILTKKHTK